MEQRRNVGLLGSQPIGIDVPIFTPSEVIAVVTPTFSGSWAGVSIDLSMIPGTPTLPIIISFDVWIPESLLEHFRADLPSIGHVHWFANFASNDDGIRFTNRDWDTSLGSIFRCLTINSDNYHIDSELGSGWSAYPELITNAWVSYYWEVIAGGVSHNIMKINGETIVDADYDWAWGSGDIETEFDFGTMGASAATSEDILYYRNIQLSSGDFSFGPASSIEDFQGHAWLGVNNAYDDPGPV